MYPYPSYGAAGPVSGGLEGRQGRVLDADPLEEDRGGKGVKNGSGPGHTTGTSRYVISRRSGCTPKCVHPH